VINITEPREILIKLKEYRRAETNFTAASVRLRLYALKMKSKEKVSEFCEKFDSIVREAELCEGNIPISLEEQRSAFYNAVSPFVPELVTAHLLQTQNNKTMNLEDIKLFLLQLEASRNLLAGVANPKAA